MKKIIKISNRICGALLVVLGFSAVLTSCDKKYGTPVPEYGAVPLYGVPPSEAISEKATDKVVDDTTVIVDVNDIDLTPKN